jgi:hypothetical protein
MTVKISQLTASSALTSDDFLPVVDAGTLTTLRVSAQKVLDYISGSTFNTLTVISLTSSNITGTTAQFTDITASYSGSGANLTNIPNSGLVNSVVTVGTTSISLGETATTVQGVTVLTGSTVTGSTALFTTITGSTVTGSLAKFTTLSSSNLVVSGGNAVFYETALDIGDSAYILYDSSIDKLAAFPGLYITGAITASTSISASNVGATTAIFGQVTGSTAYFSDSLGIGTPTPNAKLDVSGSTIISENLTVTGSTILSGGVLMYGTASLSVNPTAAYIYYDSNLDNLRAFPGLNISGSTIVSGNLTVTGSNSSIAFSASNSLHWTGTTPVTLQEALNRIAAAIYSGITGSIA